MDMNTSKHIIHETWTYTTLDAPDTEVSKELVFWKDDGSVPPFKQETWEFWYDTEGNDTEDKEVCIWI